MANLEYVEVTTGPSPGKAVIWLHGLGADGHDFEPIVPQLRLPDGPGVRFVFPHAPVRPVTLNGGMAMRAWYDILSLDRAGREDETGMRESVTEVESLIRLQLEDGLAAGDIALAGFSQGGAVALLAALRYPAALAGVMSLSAYLPLQRVFEDEASAANRAIPIFMAHGTQDPMLPADLGRQARDFLTRHNYSVQWSEYPMAHELCADEIAAIGTWLTSVLDL